MIFNLENGVRITASGYYLPERIVSNDQLIRESGLPITDEWIKKRIGINKRHRAAENELTSDMAVKAARMAIEQSGTDPESIELIILSTISPDNPNPSTACAVQEKLGISPSLCTAFDISAACSGFLYALEAASRYILTGTKKALVISSEIRSKFTNPKDPSTYAIFGDGAAAVILEPAEDVEGLIGIKTLADGRSYYSVYIPAGGTQLPASEQTVRDGGHFIKMNNGEKIFFEVVEGMTEHTVKFLDECGYPLDEIDHVIPHQANLQILKEVNKRLNLPDGKMLVNIQDAGNTSSASIPIVLAQNLESGKIRKGDFVFMVSAGAGATMGLALVKI